MNPGELVEQAVERSLLLIETWPAWDGQPLTADDGRIYTPHKAIRRIADHIVDHLAEVEALLAGVPTQPDEWQASALTSQADLAPFTVEDAREAEQRLRRLGRTFALRYAAVDPAEWDKERGPNRTLRQTAEHLAESEWYADQVGRTSITHQPGRSDPADAQPTA
jgi:glutamine synthetase adenylyltransferase